MSCFPPKPYHIKTFSKVFLADMETPVSCYHKFSNAPHSFMLESMENDGSRGRYSIIGHNPIATFKHYRGNSQIAYHHNDYSVSLNQDPFSSIRQLLKSIRFDLTAPFECGFLAGYIGYDTIRYIEKIPDANGDPLDIPEMFFTVPSEVIIFDNIKHTIKVVLHYVVADSDTEDWQITAQNKFDKLVGFFATPKADVVEIHAPLALDASRTQVTPEEHAFTESVKKAKSYIYEGDIFQVVLSRRFQMPITSDALKLFRMLRLVNPSPYMYYFRFPDFEIIGSSPETLVKYDLQKVTVYPIAGTRPRGKDHLEDCKIAEELLVNEKELAEHVMLVDLGRNDLGKIAQYGTVQVESFKKIERFSHVMHISSIVSAQLNRELDAIDAFKACFPAGTVSGAPKIRAMEIIDELEAIRRGPYSGAIGYFDFQGRMDTCIAIRTIWTKDKIAYWQAGAGIVADSDPAMEENETKIKAQALLSAILMAQEDSQ